MRILITARARRCRCISFRGCESLRGSKCPRRRIRPGWCIRPGRCRCSRRCSGRGGLGGVRRWGRRYVLVSRRKSQRWSWRTRVHCASGCGRCWTFSGRSQKDAFLHRQRLAGGTGLKDCGSICGCAGRSPEDADAILPNEQQCEQDDHHQEQANRYEYPDKNAWLPSGWPR